MEKFKTFFDSLLSRSEQKVLLFFLFFGLLGYAIDLTKDGKTQESFSNKTIEKALENDVKVLFDIRTASGEELQLISGIGPKMAEKIIAKREEFESLEDLMSVKGIGSATFKKLSPHFIKFGKKFELKEKEEKSISSEYSKIVESININTAEADELVTIKGIGPVTAQKIIQFRVEKGNFKDIEDLLKVKGIGAKTLEKMRKFVIVQ